MQAAANAHSTGLPSLELKNRVIALALASLPLMAQATHSLIG